MRCSTRLKIGRTTFDSWTTHRAGGDTAVPPIAGAILMSVLVRDEDTL
jgi:hypothetical protein